MPLGLLRLTTLPMGATNSVQILQGDISLIIQEEMPNIAAAFMDNMNIRGVKNGFSYLTKEQEGQDCQGKDVTNDRQ